MIKTLLTKLSKNILYKILFIKYFYKFIFLHKPLCERYKDNTLKIFGIYFCRSCLILYTGFILSLIFCILTIKTVKIDNYFYLGLTGLILTFGMSYPPVYSKLKRISKDFIRLYDGIFLAALFVVCFKIHWELGFLALFAFVFIRNLYNIKRNGNKVCKDCPDLTNDRTCTGYIQQKEALLKLDEEYSNIMMNRLNKERKINL